MQSVHHVPSFSHITQQRGIGIAPRAVLQYLTRRDGSDGLVVVFEEPLGVGREVGLVCPIMACPARLAFETRLADTISS